MYYPVISIVRSQQYPGYMKLGSEKQGSVLEQCLEDQFISPHRFCALLHETVNNLLAGRGVTNDDWSEMRRLLDTEEGLKKIDLHANDNNLPNNVLLTLSVPDTFSFDLCLIPCITNEKRRCKSMFILPC